MKVVSVAWRSWARGTRSSPAYSIDRCAQQSHLLPRTSTPFRARYNSGWANGPKQGGPNRWNRRILFASGSAVAGASVLAFTDDIKASYETVERTGRVAVVLFVCINEWVFLAQLNLGRWALMPTFAATDEP